MEDFFDFGVAPLAQRLAEKPIFDNFEAGPAVFGALEELDGFGPRENATAEIVLIIRIVLLRIILIKNVAISSY